MLLSLGPLVARKNPALLIETFAEIRRAAGDDVTLVWIGSGPMRAELEALVSSLGLDGSVVFTGYLPEADKVPMLNLADVFVFASLLEGFPLAPQEAMSCGKPVVAFRVASLREMVEEGDTGFLVGPHDRPAFAERVVTSPPRARPARPLRGRGGRARRPPLPLGCHRAPGAQGLPGSPR